MRSFCMRMHTGDLGLLSYQNWRLTSWARVFISPKDLWRIDSYTMERKDGSGGLTCPGRFDWRISLLLHCTVGKPIKSCSLFQCLAWGLGCHSLLMLDCGVDNLIHVYIFTFCGNHYQCAQYGIRYWTIDCWSKFIVSYQDLRMADSYTGTTQDQGWDKP